MTTPKDDLAALIASVPVRSVSGPESPTRVDLQAQDPVQVVRPSSQEIRASVPELSEMAAKVARMEAMLDESAKERIRRQARDEFDAERRKMMAEESERQRIESERKLKTLAQYVAITTALLTTLSGIAVQMFNAYQAGK